MRKNTHTTPTIPDKIIPIPPRKTRRVMSCSEASSDIAMADSMRLSIAAGGRTFLEGVHAALRDARRGVMRLCRAAESCKGAAEMKA